jgi:flagellin-like protein
MNYTRKFKKNAKALSPVVASIILIAVTVAVSVVVAAWMGGMSIGLMGNAEQLTVTNVEFVTGTPNNSVVLSILNNGGSDAQISAIYVNGQSGYMANTTAITKGTISAIAINLDWASSTSYEFKITTTKGNNVAYSQVSPVA